MFILLYVETNASEITRHLNPNDEWTLSSLVKNANVAGDGKFINPPSPTNQFAILRVVNYWTSGTSNETVSIKFNDNTTNWNVPTNVPVVFFAMHSVNTNAFLLGLGGDNSWYCKTNDNGLVYDFTTNLWNCLRSGEYSQTNYYEILRSASNIPIEDSSKVYMDSRDAIGDLFYKMPTEFLIESMQDQLLHEYIRDSLWGRVLRRGWTHTNGVWYAPPPE